MKKMIFLLTLLVVSTYSVNAQIDKFKVYAGAGVNYSSGAQTNGAEVGIYNSKVWYSLGTSYSKDASGYNTWFGSFKAYKKISKYRFVDGYAWGAVNMQLDQTKALSLEPGLAAVFNIGEKWAPQVSVSLPIQENKPLYSTIPINLGLSLNYWF